MYREENPAFTPPAKRPAFTPPAKKPAYSGQPRKGNADVGYFQNSLRGLMEDPSSFQESPGYAFARDQGLEALNRSNSRMRGSGNALADLVKMGSGYAAQEYGSQLDRMGSLLGQEQQYDLGEDQNRVARERIAADQAMQRGRISAENNWRGAQLGLDRDKLGLDRELGLGRLGADRDRLGLDRDLGMGRLGNERRGQDFDFTLGMGRNANDRERSRFDFDLGMDRNNLTAADQQNRFNLDRERNRIDWFRAGTDRGGARSRDYYAGQDSRNRNRDPWGGF